MSKWYRLIFKQLQPIHIGANNYGVIKETRIFIPGITMWGALTNAYGKGKGWIGKDYENEKNQKIFENITCFYPMIDGALWYPRYKDGEFYLWKYYINKNQFVEENEKENNIKHSEQEFRKNFTTTYLSTSINPLSLNAKDESLHEFDVILPKDKQNQKELFWVGYLKIDDKNKIPNEIYIGGESRYGLGLMELERIEKENYQYEVKKGIFQNHYPENEPLSNSLKFENGIEFEGEIELLAEFDFSQNRPKLKENSGNFYISVGSKIKLRS